MKLLTRRGYLIEEQDMIYLAKTDTEIAMTSLQSAAYTYRIALGLRAGQKVLTLQSLPRFDVQPTQQHCVNEPGSSYFRSHDTLRRSRGLTIASRFNGCHGLPISPWFRVHRPHPRLDHRVALVGF